MQLTAKALLLSGLLIGGSTQLAYAQTTPGAIPKCEKEGFSFAGNQLILNTDNSPLIQRVFIIKNIAGYTILMNHNDPNSQGGHTGWATKLSGASISVAAINTRNFSLFCMGYNPPQFGMVNCQNVLSVCAFPPQEHGVGTFWVTENKSDSDVQAALVERKIFG